MKSIDVGETAITQVEVKDDAGNYVDPTTSITITIYDGEGNKVVDGVAMTKKATGKYEHDYTVPEEANTESKRKHRVIVDVTDGTRVTVGTAAFKVV